MASSSSVVVAGTTTPLSTAGVRVGYCVSNSASTVPTSGFIHIPDLKSTPDFSMSPNTADASTFDNVEYVTYIDLLKDLGGALEFGCNLTDMFKDRWDACVAAYDGMTSSQYMHFCIAIPGMSDFVSFVGKPSNIGLPSLSANALAEGSVYVTPLGEPTWTALPTPTGTENPIDDKLFLVTTA